MNKYIIINNIYELKVLYDKLQNYNLIFSLSLEEIITFIENSDGEEENGYEKHLDYQQNEKIIIIFISKYLTYYRRYKYKDDYDDWDDYEYFNIQVLLREEKLQRIIDDLE